MNKNVTSYLEIINCFLLGLLPFLLITGPALPDNAISFSGIITLILIFKKKKWFYLKNNFFIIFSIWCFYLIFVSLISEYKWHSLESSLFYIRFGVFSLSVWYLMNSNKKEFFFKILKFVILFTFIILILDSFFQFIFGYNILGFPYKGLRLSSFFGDEHKLGSYFSRMLPILFAFASAKLLKNKIEYYFGIVALLSADIIIYLSGERTAFFYAILFSLSVIFLTKNYKIIRIITLILSIFILTILTFNFDKVKERMIDRTTEQIAEIEEVYSFTAQHQTIYKTSLKIFKDHYLLGIGPKNFRIICKEKKYQTLTKLDRSINGCQTHSHNTYIQLLTETGFFGFIFVFLIFIIITYYFLKHFILKIFYKKDLFADENLFYLLAIYISLWPIAPTGNFFGNWLSIIYFFPVGFLLNNYYQYKNNDKYL